MEEDKETFELVKLLKLPVGEPVDERLRRWAEAFEAWLAGRRTRCHRSVGLLSHQAWREFLVLSAKAPWEVDGEDVNAYTGTLEARGVRPKTIANLLTPLASFYAYCQENGVDAQCGADFNPVNGARRPKIIHYEKARSLSEKEEAALLEAIQRDDSPISKRDYALILTLLVTGWKSLRVRTLTWGKLGEEGNRGEGLPMEVGEAIREYLEAAGRWEGIREEEYVFVPLRNPLVNERQDRAEDWEGGRPLSQRQLHALVKLHAEMAGLKAEAITCHTLRHTAAARRLKRGESLDAVGVFLGCRGKRTTRYYLRRLQESPKGRLKARRRRTAEQEQVRSRKPHHFQRRHHLSLTHGLRAKYLPEFETLAEKGIRLDAPDAAVLRWRIVVQRATYFSERVETVREAARLLKVVTQASGNLIRAIKLREQIRAMMREIGEEEVISEK